MKFSKLGLLTLLISLFILSSCKRQDGIGLGVDENNQLNGTIFADTNIVSNTVLEDTVSTTGLARSPLSFFTDPEFGVTESNIAAQLTLPDGAAYTLPTGTITVDSALLVLPYAPSGFYGDSLTSKFKIDVHQLNEKFSLNTTYYNNKQWDVNPTVIGTKTFTARSHDTLSIKEIVKGAADTFKKVAPQVRIPISMAFLNTYFFNAPATSRSNTLAFQNAVKGLYLTLDKTGTTGPGGNLMFLMDSVRIDLYFKSASTTTDTTKISLKVVDKGHMASIKHTYSTKVQAALNNTSTDGLVYLQGLAGLRAKISFPDIKKTFAALGTDVVINRAELVVTAAPGTIIPYAPAARLTMYKLDLAKQRTQVQDASGSDPRGTNGLLYFGGYYGKTDNQYHFLVTAFVQDLIRGKTVDYGTYIAPVDPTNSAATSQILIAPTPIYAERTITPGKNSPYRIKLNIIYTKINQ